MISLFFSWIKEEGSHTGLKWIGGRGADTNIFLLFQGGEGGEGRAEITLLLWPHHLHKNARAVADCSLISGHSSTCDFTKGELTPWAQSKSTQEASWQGSCVCSDITGMPMHAHARGRAGKGSRVQILFNFHLLGLVFLDLESRCKDQPMINAFGNLVGACYLLSNAWWIM